MNKSAAPRTIRLVASLVLFAYLVVGSSAQAETNYCAGYRVGFVLAYCAPRNSSCLNQRVRCPRAIGGTMNEGLRDGRAYAFAAKRAELRLVREILRRRQENGK